MKKMTFNGVASTLNEKEMQNVMAGSAPHTAVCWFMGPAVFAGLALGPVGWVQLAFNAQHIAACWNN